jgi:hypothetical protein
MNKTKPSMLFLFEPQVYNMTRFMEGSQSVVFPIDDLSISTVYFTKINSHILLSFYIGLRNLFDLLRALSMS